MNPQKSLWPLMQWFTVIFLYNLSLLLNNWTMEMGVIALWHARQWNRECYYWTLAFRSERCTTLQQFLRDKQFIRRATEAWMHTHTQNLWQCLSNNSPSVCNPKKMRTRLTGSAFKKKRKKKRPFNKKEYKCPFYLLKGWGEVILGLKRYIKHKMMCVNRSLREGLGKWQASVRKHTQTRTHALNS